MARITVRDEKQYEQDTWRTVANHVREILKEDYKKTEEHVWGYIDMSSPSGLSQEQIGYLNDLFCVGSNEKIILDAHTYSQQKQGIITDQEAEKQFLKNNKEYYKGIFKDFKKKFGINPISIPKWILKEEYEKQERCAWE